MDDWWKTTDDENARVACERWAEFLESGSTEKQEIAILTVVPWLREIAQGADPRKVILGRLPGEAKFAKRDSVITEMVLLRWAGGESRYAVEKEFAQKFGIKQGTLHQAVSRSKKRVLEETKARAGVTPLHAWHSAQLDKFR